jgi:hypothetical protein
MQVAEEPVHATAGQLLQPEGEVVLQQGPHAAPVRFERPVPVAPQRGCDPLECLGGGCDEFVEQRVRVLIAQLVELGVHQMVRSRSNRGQTGLEAGRAARWRRGDEVGDVAVRRNQCLEQPQVLVRARRPDPAQPGPVNAAGRAVAQSADAGDRLPDR